MRVKFFIRKTEQKQLKTIRVRIRIGRAVDLSMATKESVSINDWDEVNEYLLEVYQVEKNGRLTTKRDAETKIRIRDNREVNRRLFELKRKIEKEYKDGPESIDRLWLKSIIYPELVNRSNDDLSFINYCDTFISSKGTSISKAYITKVKSIKEILKRYLSSRKIETLNLIDLDIKFKNDFERYCIEEEKYSVNYVERNFKFIKTILYHAKLNGHEVYSGLSAIKGKTEKTSFEILTSEDLSKIESTNFSDEHLQSARDWLLISCYCGQRISDFMRFTVRKISKRLVEGEEIYFIDFIQEKTKKQLVLPLHHKIIEILNTRGWEFPRKMSATKYNLHIKRVCKESGIDNLVFGSLSLKETEVDSIKRRKKNNRRKVTGYYPKYRLISSHVGRRTFASLNFGKIPTPLLMVATGHSTPNMLMKYIGKIDEQQSMALAKYLK